MKLGDSRESVEIGVGGGERRGAGKRDSVKGTVSNFTIITLIKNKK